MIQIKTFEETEAMVARWILKDGLAVALTLAERMLLLDLPAPVEHALQDFVERHTGKFV